MTNNNDDLLLQWLNEEIPLDNNEITDDEDNITKGKDLFSVVDNNPSEENIVTNELEIENEDSFEFILDNTDINFSNIIEPVEPVVIAVPTSTQTVNLHDKAIFKMLPLRCIFML
ncbi:hypothetical protein QTP88_023133 [Uroleucon formosanum]